MPAFLLGWFLGGDSKRMVTGLTGKFMLYIPGEIGYITTARKTVTPTIHSFPNPEFYSKSPDVHGVSR